MLSGCAVEESAGVPDAAPSVYYWRGTLRLDAMERAFLKEHDVRKVYLRLFDVVKRGNACVPAGTIEFRDTLPNTLHVVPTIFITEECLRADTTELAAKLVERVVKMCRVNRLNNIAELQVDCDWTPHSREAYYALLERIRTCLAQVGNATNADVSRQSDKSWRLSVTIRLHQLNQPAPPADYGVLMVYNTGDYRQRNARNPILAYEDVEPYVRFLKDYKLPLCAAYPNFCWKRLFHGDRFKGFLYSENLSDSTVYESLAGDSLYRVVQGRTLHGALQSDYDIHLSPEDEVVVNRPAPEEMLRIARMLQTVRPNIHGQVIFYHLDKNFMNLLSTEQYEAFYHFH